MKIKARWNKNEIDLLISNYSTNPTIYIAKEIGKSYKSVQCKALRLGLVKEINYIKSINLGRKHIFTEDHKKKIGLSQIGRKSWNKGLNKYNNSSIKKQSNSIKGKMAGSKHPSWRGGVTPLKERIRNTIEYKDWRTVVFIRDNYTCVLGGKSHGSELEAHHIKPFIYFPKLWFVISNGLTLCKNCHRKEKKFSPNREVKVNIDYFNKYLSL